jgi:hypothetical protein
MSAEAPSRLAVELRKMLVEKKPDGTPRFSDVDRRAVQAVIYIELARRHQDLSVFDHQQKVTLAELLDEIGVSEHTDPADVAGLVRDYFMKLNANAAVFVRLDRLLKRFKKIDDRVEAIKETETAYSKLTEQDAKAAPSHDDKAPDGSKPAQSLAQSLGVKVRI